HDYKFPFCNLCRLDGTLDFLIGHKGGNDQKIIAGGGIIGVKAIKFDSGMNRFSSPAPKIMDFFCNVVGICSKTVDLSATATIPLLHPRAKGSEPRVFPPLAREIIGKMVPDVTHRREDIRKVD